MAKNNNSINKNNLYVLIITWNFKLAHPNDLILYSKSHLLETKKNHLTQSEMIQ